jgi:hypothetical protein
LNDRGTAGRRFPPRWTVRTLTAINPEATLRLTRATFLDCDYAILIEFIVLQFRLMVSAAPALISQWTIFDSLVSSLGTDMKRKLGVVATAVLLGGFVPTNAFAASGGGHTGGLAGVIAGGRVGALAIIRGVGGVGFSAGSPRPFLTITPPNARIGSLAIGRELGGVISTGSPGPVLTRTPRDGRLYSVPLIAGARFSPSNLYSEPLNSRQPSAPQANMTTSAAIPPRARTPRVEALTETPLSLEQKVARSSFKPAVISPPL